MAQQSIELMMDIFKQSRKRFESGVSQNVDAVQSQELVASANVDYVDRVFAHNLAKLNTACALGDALDKLVQFLPSPSNRQSKERAW